MNILFDKLKEVIFTVLPITIIVLILHFTITPLQPIVLVRFLLGALFIIIGLSIFLLGVDVGLTPIGNYMGEIIAKTNKLVIVFAVTFILGFFVNIAEPDLHILADQVDFVTSGNISKTSILIVVSIGIAVMLASGLLRIVYNTPLHKFLTLTYILILILALFTSSEFMAIAFDASGATTGALTVPFILALAVGVSSLKKDSKASEEDSFGLVGIASAGAIIMVMFLSIVSGASEIPASLSADEIELYNNSILRPFVEEFPNVVRESLVALAPLVALFVIFQLTATKLTRKTNRRIAIGVIYTFIGLVLFLTGVHAGFMNVGSIVGYNIASMGNKFLLILIGFILGLLTVLAEPAVHVLTHQIEDITSGYVKRKVVMFSLSIGVGISAALSIMRILIPNLKLWHILLPGYIIAIILMYLVPDLFVGIAFDAGGVASGPMTATFTLAFAQGAAEATEGANVLIDGFGMIALVALTPLITLQILGYIYRIKSGKGGLQEDGE